MTARTGRRGRDDDRVTVGADQLEIAWKGDPAITPTLVLLHEGLGCVKLWRDFPSRLATRMGTGVFAYSRAGYGASSARPAPWPLDYMGIEAREILPGVLDAIGLEHGVLVGHSDGATIAAIHAGEMNDPRISGLVLIAPHFFTETRGLESIAAAREAFSGGDLRARLAFYHGANVDDAFGGWNRAWLDPGFRDWSILHLLPRIEVPVLVLQGEDDEYGTFAQVEAVQTRCEAPVTVRMFSDCGHSPHRERTDEVLDAIAGFVADLPTMR